MKVTSPFFPLAGKQFVAVLGFTVMSLLAVVLSFNWKFLEPLQVLTTAVETTAQVQKIDEYVYAKSKKTANYQVQYRFQVDGKNFGGVTPTKVKPGETIQIWYVPSNPRKSDSDLKGHAIIDLVLFAVPSLILLLCLLVLVVHLRSPRQDPVS